jgi:hypothetical protein
MNNLKYYDDYLNEGFYDWINKRFDIDNKEGMITLIMVVLAGLCQGAHLPFDTDDIVTPLRHLIVILIGGFLSIPAFVLILRAIFRNPYDSLRVRTLLRSTNKKYKKMMDMIEEYPEIEDRLNDIKNRMRDAIENENKENISLCVHDIYKLSKQLKKKQSLGELFAYTEEEKARIKAKKAYDPYGEEKLEDEPKNENWWEKR